MALFPAIGFYRTFERTSSKSKIIDGDSSAWEKQTHEHESQESHAPLTPREIQPTKNLMMAM